MKTILRYLIPVLVVLAVMFSLAQPVLAASEPPPPGGDAGSKPAHAKPSGTEKPLPPIAAPDQVTPAAQGSYQGDAALTDARGNAVKAAKLAVLPLFTIAVQGCPPGVWPTWMDGSGVGCTTTGYSGDNAINDAIADTHVLANWGVFAPMSAYRKDLNIYKAISVIGQDENTTSIGDILTSKSVFFTTGKATLYNFTVYGQIYASGQTGALRLGNLNVVDPGGEAIKIVNQNGPVELANVVSNGNGTNLFIASTSAATSVTISNSVFNGATGQAGMQIDTKGAVRIENVVANGSRSYGLNLVHFGPSLTIKNSTFNGNAAGDPGTGFGIFTSSTGPVGGKVTLLNVQANGNAAGGVFLYHQGDFLADNSQFNGNAANGLDVTTSGRITLTRSAVNGNSNQGANLTGGSLGVTLNGVEFSGNTNTGVSVYSGGNITLNQVVADDNANGNGVHLAAATLTKGIKNITVTNSDFSGNNWNGLAALNLGTITINHVTASNNGEGGILLVNCMYNTTTSKCDGKGAVTVTSTAGRNTFSHNFVGLEIRTGGAVTISGVDATNNTYTGIDIVIFSGTGAVTVSDALLAGNEDDGLWVGSGGSLLLNRVRALNNGKNGVTLYNSDGAAKTVTINTSQFSNNQKDGLDVYSKGAITLNNVTANDNVNGSGASLSTSGAISLVSTSGQNDFSRNHFNGLVAVASGNITLNNVTADSNSVGRGIILDNSGGTGTVTVRQTNASYNTTGGLDVKSKGAITLDMVNFGNSSAGFGANLDNSAAVRPSTVNITRSVFSENNVFGLSVLSKGAITLNYVEASLNTSDSGAFLDNCNWVSAACTGVGAVTVTNLLGTNNFNQNGSSGLEIQSNGAISLKEVWAMANLAAGLVVANHYNAISAPISFNQVTSEYNKFGMYINSHGAVSLNNVRVNYNNVYGAEISNQVAVSPQKVDILNSQFSGNQQFGLEVYSKGAITLDHVEASSNTGSSETAHRYGAYLDNCVTVNPTDPCANVASVTIKNTLGDNIFNGNYDANLIIHSNGVVSVTGVTANNSLLGNGVDIIHNGSTANVNVNGMLLSGNHGYGLGISSKGSITLNGIIATQNQQGLSIVTSTGGDAISTITVNKSSFNSNTHTGAYFQADGNVTLNNISAIYNNDAGVAIQTLSGHLGNVSILGTLGPNRFDNNGRYGLGITSANNITINYATANYNGTALGPEGDSGMILNVSSTKTIQVNCSTANFNGKSGIEATLVTGTLTLKGVSLFSNDQLDGAYDPNLAVTGGTTIVQPWMCSN
jgi:hypothetical protein